MRVVKNKCLYDVFMEFGALKSFSFDPGLVCSLRHLLCERPAQSLLTSIERRRFTRRCNALQHMRLHLEKGHVVQVVLPVWLEVVQVVRGQAGQKPVNLRSFFDGDRDVALCCLVVPSLAGLPKRSVKQLSLHLINRDAIIENRLNLRFQSG